MSGTFAAPASSEIIQAWCHIGWSDNGRPTESGACDFHEANGRVQVSLGDRWSFDFRSEDRHQWFRRVRYPCFVRFKRGGYILDVFQGGKPAYEPNGCY